MVYVLNDHRDPKPTKSEQQFEQTKRMIEHYMVQIPALVASALDAALTAYDMGRRDEFAAWADARKREYLDTANASPHTGAAIELLDHMLAVFGPRKPMPEQPEVES